VQWVEIPAHLLRKALEEGRKVEEVDVHVARTARNLTEPGELRPETFQDHRREDGLHLAQHRSRAPHGYPKIVEKLRVGAVSHALLVGLYDVEKTRQNSACRLSRRQAGVKRELHLRRVSAGNKPLRLQGLLEDVSCGGEQTHLPFEKGNRPLPLLPVTLDGQDLQPPGQAPPPPSRGWNKGVVLESKAEDDLPVPVQKLEGVQPAPELDEPRQGPHFENRFETVAQSARRKVPRKNRDRAVELTQGGDVVHPPPHNPGRSASAPNLLDAAAAAVETPVEGVIESGPERLRPHLSQKTESLKTTLDIAGTQVRGHMKGVPAGLRHLSECSGRRWTWTCAS